MSQKTKKLLIMYLPYVLVGLVATNLGEAWRLATGGTAGEKILSLMYTVPQAFGNPLPIATLKIISNSLTPETIPQHHRV